MEKRIKQLEDKVKKLEKQLKQSEVFMHKVKKSTITITYNYGKGEQE